MHACMSVCMHAGRHIFSLGSHDLRSLFVLSEGIYYDAGKKLKEMLRRIARSGQCAMINV